MFSEEHSKLWWKIDFNGRYTQRRAKCGERTTPVQKHHGCGMMAFDKGGTSVLIFDVTTFRNVNTKYF